MARNGQRKARVSDGIGFERQSNESEVQHRAMLLWAMQDIGRRSYRAVGGVLSRADTTISNWAAMFAWSDRSGKYGEASQARACRDYRETYYPKKAMLEVAAVERLMSVPFLLTSPPPDEQGRGDAARTIGEQSTEKASDADKPSAVGGARGTIQTDRDERRKNLQRTTQVVDALVGQLVRDLQQGKVHVKPGDLPGLYKLRQLCAEDLGDAPRITADAAPLAPSYRVMVAVRAGTSVVSAMREDALEALAVLEGLEAAEEVASELRTARDSPNERGQVG